MRLACRFQTRKQEVHATFFAATTSIKTCIRKLIIPSEASDVDCNREFARSFAFAQDDN